MMKAILIFAFLFPFLPVIFTAHSPISGSHGEIAPIITDAEIPLDLILIGDSGVGKSNLLMRYTKNEFDSERGPTIRLELFTKLIRFHQNWIKARIWDLAGNTRYRSGSTAYYRRASGALLVFDITNRKSFVNAERWLRELREFAPLDIVILLVGNVSELECNRAVSVKEAVSFAERNGIFYIETSALFSVKVHDAFEYTLEECYKIALQKLELNRRAAGEITVADIPFIASTGTRIDFDPPVSGADASESS